MSKRHSRHHLLKCLGALANKYKIPHDSRWLCTIRSFIEDNAKATLKLDFKVETVLYKPLSKDEIKNICSGGFEKVEDFKDAEEN